MLLMGNSTISMAIFNSYVSLPEGIWKDLKAYAWQPGAGQAILAACWQRPSHPWTSHSLIILDSL